MKRHFDGGTIFDILVTGLLFIVALFVKVFIHELILEAWVLLVSIKLIMMAYRNSFNYEEH